MSKILIVAEHDGAKLNPSTGKCVTCAAKVPGASVDVLVLAADSAGVAAQAFSALAERSINIRAITTSEIKFSLLIDAAFTELAVRTLHSLYGLDKA